jgi:hypothetical protein
MLPPAPRETIEMGDRRVTGFRLLDSGRYAAGQGAGSELAGGHGSHEMLGARTRAGASPSRRS